MGLTTEALDCLVAARELSVTCWHISALCERPLRVDSDGPATAVAG
jgi:hypothetical protein